MNDLNLFEKVCRAMTSPEFFPHDVSRIHRKETHISVVFLTGKWVYKIKKPVRYDFLDFMTLKRRKRFCECEVQLNQRLSEGIYQAVKAIYETKDGRISLEPGGRVVEYAVKMVQLPDEENLSYLLKKRAVTLDHMRELGRILSEFYQKSEKSPDIDRFGQPDMILYNMAENFSEIEPFVDRLPDDGKWEFIAHVSRRFLEDHKALFHRRVNAGKIQDGHGDLRADHIYFHNGTQIIDCIEFNNRFRYGDAALDMSFLYMDLDHLGHPETGRQLIHAYAANAKDPEIYALLDFYAAYRAVVRLKVALFSYRDEGEEYRHKQIRAEVNRFFYQAYQYAIMFSRPTLWIFSGLPASGKSTLALSAANALFVPVFGSDAVRKKKFSEQDFNVISYNAGSYRKSMRGLVYGELLGLAQETLKSGRSVILDATFSDAKWRDAARLLASDMDTTLIFVECVCRKETMESRLREREGRQTESDARLIHLDQMIAEFQPYDPGEGEPHIRMDTDGPFDDMLVDMLRKSHELQNAQIKNRIHGNGT